MVLLVPSNNIVWHESRRFAKMRQNAEDVNSETVTVELCEYLSAVGGWIKSWRHIN